MPDEGMDPCILCNGVRIYIPLKEEHIHRDTRDIRPKSSLPDATDNCPWRKELGHIFQGKEGRAPMFLSQMFQTGTDRAFPHCAPLDRAMPQLSQFQMECDHVISQCRINLHVTDGAKVRGIVAKRLVRTILSILT